ncbi:MAG: flagellar basal body protein FliL [Treponema sp.]|nr:flagellar basal body protein FliL [Treponema sp.]
MNEAGIVNSKISNIIYTILLVTVFVLVIIIAGGTVFAFLRPGGTTPLITTGSREMAQYTAQNAAHNDDIRVYPGLGRQRIPLADSRVVILSVTFPYSANDTAFTEELASKVDDFRLITSDYFTSLPADAQIDEDAAKRAILRRYNENLRLGRIEAVYFSDFLIIE